MSRKELQDLVQSSQSIFDFSEQVAPEKDLVLPKDEHRYLADSLAAGIPLTKIKEKLGYPYWKLYKYARKCSLYEVRKNANAVHPDPPGEKIDRQAFTVYSNPDYSRMYL